MPVRLQEWIGVGSAAPATAAAAGTAGAFETDPPYQTLNAGDRAQAQALAAAAHQLAAVYAAGTVSVEGTSDGNSSRARATPLPAMPAPPTNASQSGTPSDLGGP